MKKPKGKYFNPDEYKKSKHKQKMDIDKSINQAVQEYRMRHLKRGK